MIDAHAHLYTEELRHVLSDIVTRFEQNGGTCIVNCAADPSSCQKVLEQYREYPILHPTVGLHPELLIPGCDIYIEGVNGRWISTHVQRIRELISQHEEIIAVGECGLDYYWIKHERLQGLSELYKRQKDLFSAQVELAVEVNLPLVIHCRDEMGDKQAEAEALEILVKKGAGVKALFHSYTGSLSYLEDMLNLGYYISFNAIVMFKNATNVRELLDATPLDQLLVETDSPWLVPPGHRSAGASVCEPVFVDEVARFVAKRKGVSVEKLWRQVGKNMEELYGAVPPVQS